jgi:hypothetical protein
MRIDPRAYAFAAGITAAVLFTLCSLAVAIAPASATAFLGYLVHTDFSSLQRTLTVGSFIGGLIGWTVGTVLTFGFAAVVYNRLLAAPRTDAAARGQPLGQRA